MDFSASLDTTAKVITGLITVLFLAVIFGPYAFTQTENMPHVLIGLFLFAIYGLTYAFRPVKYTIENDQLIIRRPFKDISIALDHIKTAETSNNLGLFDVVRVFGVGGLFGYYGRFYNAKRGNMNWYVTNTNKLILLTLGNNKKVGISPDDTNGFIRTLNQ